VPTRPINRVSQENDTTGSHSPRSTEEFFSRVYDELKRIATARLDRELHHTIGATDLVNEAYLRLATPNREGWANRFEFFAAAALAMRRILVDRARQRNSLKRGGQSPLTVTEFAVLEPKTTLDVLAVDEALAKLALVYPRHAQLVQLRFFAGLTIKESAEVLGVSTTIANRDWTYAKTWLRLELKTD
jgi:RNA polymerase sigma factor (TIGR02999 family)